ncbi:Pentatricopeptide repeat, partial [Trema orientale]
MAEKVALPLLLPNPPPSKPFSPNQLHTPAIASAAPPITPILQDFLHHNSIPNPNPCPPQPQKLHIQSPIPRNRTRIGRSRDANRGRPWSHHGISFQGQQFLNSLIDPEFNPSSLNQLLLQLVESHRHGLGSGSETLALDVLCIVKGLGFYKKCDLALSVFEWFRNREDCESVLSGSVAAVVISMLGKQGRVSAAASLLQNLHKDGFVLDVYAYTSLITAYVSNGRFREAVMVFNKMEGEGCQPTLITYNVILNVYGKMGMPWNKIIALLDGMKRAGVASDSYTYNTLISCCRRGALYEEAVKVFEEMKLAGFTPDKVTYNALLDVYGKSRRPKEAMEVLREMEANGFSPSIVSYNSLISAYSKDGLLEEAMALKTEMVERGIKPDVFTFTTLLSGFEKAGKDELAMKVFEEMKSLGCKPNLCTFNALIKMHGNRGNFAEMMKIFEEIKACKCTPDIVTWNTLLAVFGQNMMDSELSGVFKEMKRAGFVPERDTF